MVVISKIYPSAMTMDLMPVYNMYSHLKAMIWVKHVLFTVYSERYLPKMCIMKMYKVGSAGVYALVITSKFNILVNVADHTHTHISVNPKLQI